MTRLLIGIVGYLATTLCAFAQLQGSGVPYFPQTLPPQTLIGRYSTSPGPTEAIPFATFYSGIGAAILGQTNTWTGANTFTSSVALTGASTFTMAGASTGVVTVKPAASSGTWTWTWPTSAGSSNQVPVTNGSGVMSFAYAPVVTGSSSVVSGTGGRVLYNNAGTLGELPITGSGNAVLATAPSIATLTATGLTTVGKVATSGTAPALTSCGTSPAIVGSDTAGTVTLGTATPTTCTVTFNAAYAASPICIVSWQTNIASMQYTVSTSAISITQTATSSNKVNYHCIAQNGG